jgi:hypothetical protein
MYQRAVSIHVRRLELVLSPIPGGQSDKFGNRYEGRWTVAKILEVLAGDMTSVRVEEAGVTGEGIEFSATRRSGQGEGHQVKRQRGTANSWSVRNLASEGILLAAIAQVDVGREFHFVSTIPARLVQELTDRARSSDTVQEFVSALSKPLSDAFDLVVNELGTVPQAYAMLRGTTIHCIDERHLQSTNGALAGLLLSGAPGRAAAVVLGDLVSDRLGTTLDAAAIRDGLAEYGLSIANIVGAAGTETTVDGTYRSWEASIARELLLPEIPRDTSAEIVAAVKTPENTLVAVVGAAGGGKSAVLRQAVAAFADDWPVLAMRLDRLEPFSSTHELGTSRLGLPSSPVSSLAAAAKGGPCLMVVDQLDAVSQVSGRMPASFDTVAELLREAQAFPEMKVLVACRQFDLENDDRLRELVVKRKAKETLVAALTEAEVDDAVRAMDLDPTKLTAVQRALLQSPLNLVLLQSVADEDAALGFTTTKDLMDAFYERKRRECQQRRPDTRFGETLGVVSDYMSENQRLVAPVTVFDANDLADDADVLSSEHLLVREGNRSAFFHEAFFDYVFARRWTARGETLTQFLLDGDQELFRRAQVRQVLVHLRDEDLDRYVREVAALLDAGEIRFHIKEVVLATLRATPEPTHEEWKLLERQLNATHSLGPSVWQLLRTGPWFDRLDVEGAIEVWLSSDDGALEARALEIMVSDPKGRGDRLAELLAERINHRDFARWLQWVTRFAELSESRALFELLVEAVRAGQCDAWAHDLWLVAHDLGEKQPTWAAELLDAWFNDRPDALAVDGDGRLRSLAGTDYQAEELIRQAAGGDPTTFCRVMVPFLLGAMAATSEGSTLPQHDRHFTYRRWNNEHPDLPDQLLLSTAEALKAIAEERSEELDDHLQALAADAHDGAQWLLYSALIASAPDRADWAASLILEGEHRMAAGYTSDPFWTTRELLEAIGPHVQDDTFNSLESAMLSVRPDWESPPGGYAEFTLLSGLPERRLSETARRRLNELRRRFDRDVPDEPTEIAGGFVRSPIPQSAADHMSDEQWLRAIEKYHSSERDFRSLAGGAEQLSQLLESETKKDPHRFARLGLRLEATAHPAYPDAILKGLGGTDEEIDPVAAFEFMRHAAALEHPDNDRWIGWPLRRQLTGEIPDDIVELVVDRALHSSDPSHEAWQTPSHSGQPFYGGDPFTDGMNTGRGSAALVIGDLLAHDTTGQRTGLVQDSLAALAADPSVAVKTCVAHVLATALRHAELQVMTAFPSLVDADDRLLATRPVEQLMALIGTRNPQAIEPVIEQMLRSEHESVREAGGRAAAFAALELDLASPLVAALSADGARRGVADICAARLPFASDGELAATTLTSLLNDDDPGVRKNAAKAAGTLRDRPLSPHREVLKSLITSGTFSEALPQLLITLDHATEPVDDLILASAHRFVEQFSGEMDDISTRAAGEAGKIGDLVLRAYAQADEEGKREALDLIDRLLEQAAYGFAARVGEAER